MFLPLGIWFSMSLLFIVLAWLVMMMVFIVLLLFFHYHLILVSSLLSMLMCAKVRVQSITTGFISPILKSTPLLTLSTAYFLLALGYKHVCLPHDSTELLEHAVVLFLQLLVVDYLLFQGLNVLEDDRAHEGELLFVGCVALVVVWDLLVDACLLHELVEKGANGELLEVWLSSKGILRWF